MNPSRLLNFGSRMVLLMVLLWMADSGSAQAAERKLEGILIWGTDDAASPNPKHKPVDVALAKKLGSMLKFKNYFEETRVTFGIEDKSYTRQEMSKQCHIEVKDKGESRISVKFYGEGKLVRQILEPLPKGETLVIGGDIKNHTAWIVVLRPVEK